MLVVHISSRSNSWKTKKFFITYNRISTVYRLKSCTKKLEIRLYSRMGVYRNYQTLNDQNVQSLNEVQACFKNQMMDAFFIGLK
ncbi:hypothetical protein BpHYR1_039657 [Brachionus plicatilis]|uniref:Uncharacterized protein n=1 Tax=Brachionus plicatilis TaxID=10195 RepID=A0A3M7T306_BRAPC|nr:hypothetical protein BpHYR1_039657 [Brachionus plicatilis]